MADLKTTYLGLDLKNPVIVSSSALTNSVDKVWNFLSSNNMGANLIFILIAIGAVIAVVMGKDKEGSSNNFAYHLKVLQEDGLVEKTEEGYRLSSEGKSYAAYIEGESGEKSKFPLPCVVVVVFKNSEEVLMLKRKKEPFYGYWGFQDLHPSAEYILLSATNA